MKTIRWNKNIKVSNYNEVPGDFGNLEHVPNPSKIFKKGDTSEVKYVFKHEKDHRYIVFADDSVSIVPKDCIS